jgi:hypothetical protein
MPENFFPDVRNNLHFSKMILRGVRMDLHAYNDSGKTLHGKPLTLRENFKL